MHKILLPLFGLSLITACAQAPDPYWVNFTVRPNDEGAEIVAEVRGGPATAWVGFGVGPGASPQLVDQIEGVAAFSATGDALEIAATGRAGYRIETNGEPWQLTYQLRLLTQVEDDSFYRASTRGDDYLILVGSDAWPRFYSDSTPLTRPPEARPAGPVSGAAVRFQLPASQPDWKVVSTAWEETPNSFAMRQHPVGSVFALGPFDVVRLPDVSDLRVALHAGWDIMPDQIEQLVEELLMNHREMLSSPDNTRALALLSPMPPTLQPRAGLRTAGMVRGQTLVVYAAKAPLIPADHPDIAEAMAVFLGHELFHLWVPTGVQVTRELSWLSEGWAMHRGRRAAVATGWLDEAAGTRRLELSYRRYLDIGGYRAGSLPAASTGSEDRRNLLYLRGELVFRLLEQEWDKANPGRPFERVLWEALTAAYDGVEPLDSTAVRTILTDLVGATTVRRYVEGQAPLTPDTLGLAGQ